MDWPEHVPMYPARQDVVDYLEAYAKKYDLTLRLGETITRAFYDGHLWNITHTSGTTMARKLVVATGYNRTPKIPSWPGLESFDGTFLHSSKYRNGTAWKGRNALVIGAGNSGAEIALDLWECGARVALCVQGPLHVVPRDVLGIPAQVNSLRVMSKLPVAVADRLSLAMLNLVVGDLSPWGIHRPELGPISQVVHKGKVPLIDVGTVGLIRQGKIRVVPGIERFTEHSVVCVNGVEVQLDVVVCATGYRAAIDDFLTDASQYLDARGYPKTYGVEAGTPGLYFVGYRNPLTGAIHDIALEAVRVATHIARSP
jgi:indole-3-pyruvate monooxygenase